MPAGSNDLFRKRPDLAIEALKEQKDSLRVLTYVTSATSDPSPFESLNAGLSRIFAVDGGFSDFTQLEEVTLIGHCPAFERCMMSTTSPPNLKLLASKVDRPFLDPFTSSHAPDEPSVVSQIPFLRAPSASVPETLKTLNITYTNIHSIPGVDLMIPGSKERVRISNAADATSRMDVSLRVFLTWRGGTAWYYPPYLYGEQEPLDGLVFENGFVGPFQNSLLSRSAQLRTLMRLRGNIDED